MSNIVRHDLLPVTDTGVTATQNTRRKSVEFINESGSDVYLYKSVAAGLAAIRAGACIPLRNGNSYLDTSKDTLFAVTDVGVSASITVIEKEA